MAAAWVPDAYLRGECPEATIEEWQTAYRNQFDCWKEEAEVFNREYYGELRRAEAAAMKMLEVYGDRNLLLALRSERKEAQDRAATLLKERQELRMTRMGEANMASIADYDIARRQKDLMFFIRMNFLPGVFDVKANH